jgi:hypothetical protein
MVGLCSSNERIAACHAGHWNGVQSGIGEGGDHDKSRTIIQRRKRGLSEEAAENRKRWKLGVGNILREETLEQEGGKKGKPQKDAKNLAK